MKKFLYFLLYLCCFVTLGSLLICYLPSGVAGAIPAKVMEIIIGYVLPYGALAVSALFGFIFLFSRNPFKMILFFIHTILVVALVIAIFFPDTWAKILSIFA